MARMTAKEIRLRILPRLIRRSGQKWTANTHYTQAVIGTPAVPRAVREASCVKPPQSAFDPAVSQAFVGLGMARHWGRANLHVNRRIRLGILRERRKKNLNTASIQFPPRAGKRFAFDPGFEAPGADPLWEDLYDDANAGELMNSSADDDDSIEVCPKDDVGSS